VVVVGVVVMVVGVVVVGDSMLKSQTVGSIAYRHNEAK
jgi:hypothetical protein